MKKLHRKYDILGLYIKFLETNSPLGRNSPPEEKVVGFGVFFVCFVFFSNFYCMAEITGVD